MISGGLCSQEFSSYLRDIFCMKIIVTIIPTNLVTNSLLYFFFFNSFVFLQIALLLITVVFLRSLFIIRKILLISNFYCTNIMLRKTKSAITVITYLQQQRGQISGIAFSFVELCFVEMHRKLVKTSTNCKRKYSLQIVSV